MNVELERTMRSLRSRHINCVFAENREEAIGKITDLIPTGSVVGIGDSTTVAQIGIKAQLRKMGLKLIDGFDRGMIYASVKQYEEFHEKAIRESTLCDVFLTGTNVVTQDGRLVNVDATGNRVAGMVWGHATTIIVVGRNKIVKDLDEAFHRLRKVVAPNHIRIRAVELGHWMGGRRMRTPCVLTGECGDCRNEDRMCNVFTIIENKPARTNIHLIIINEDLGLSWDASWEQERITNIIENYKKHVWTARFRSDGRTE